MKKINITYLLILTLLISIVLSMAHPVTPALIRKLELPSFMFGVFFASMSLGNFIFSPIWGSLSDAKGRIPYLVIGLVGYGISQLGFGFVSNPVVIVFFRISGGAFVTSYITVSLAYLTDITSSNNRIKYMSYYAGAGTIGSALGSLLGGILGNSNYKVTFFWQFIFALILSVVMYLLLGETINNKRNTIKVRSNFFSFKSYGNLISNNLILIMVMVAIFFFASTSYNSTINFYIESILNLPPTFNGVFLSLAGIIGFLANIIFTPLIGKKFKEYSSFKCLTIILSIIMFIVSISKNTIIFFLFVILFVTFSSIYLPLQQSIVTKLSKGNYGKLIGLQNSAKAVGMVIGSLFAGAIFDIGSKLPFLASSIALLIGYILLIKGKINT